LNLKDYFSHFSVAIGFRGSFTIARPILKPYQGAENRLVIVAFHAAASLPHPNDLGPECADFFFSPLGY
jgi:hypothetical protein